VVTLTNRERSKVGCDPLRIDPRLVIAAQRHSAAMAANKRYTLFDRMRVAGYTALGRVNIAMGDATPEAVMDGWMKSARHRAEILNCRMRAIGVGMASSPRGPYWTQIFGWQGDGPEDT
jgi:uncharacterized protein YkwD